jgi:hypothetical protein
MKFGFEYNPRIELEVPVFFVPFEQLTQQDLAEFYHEVQMVTSKIPVKIQELDRRYMANYEKLEERPDQFFEIMDELNEISGKISELNVWFLNLEGKFIQTDGHF